GHGDAKGVVARGDRAGSERRGGRDEGGIGDELTSREMRHAAVPLPCRPKPRSGCLILLLHTPDRRGGFRGFCIMGSIPALIDVESAAMIRLRVRDVEVYLRRVRTRIPFRYGKAEVTGQPYAHLRVRCEPEVTGVSAAALPPLWFDKRPGLTHEDTIRDLLRSIAIASEVYRGAADAGAWTLHHGCEPEARRRCAAEGMNDLTAGFGVALMDAALIDASCRLAGKTFHEGLREDLFGQGSYFGALVPVRPLTRIAVRHTVGLSDPITPEDVAAPLNDGLPESLRDVIRTTKDRWFKIKLSGDVTGSLDRLRRIAEVLDQEAEDYEVTLDGNEQFHGMAEVADLVKKIRT